MERAKTLLKDVKLLLSEAVMGEDSALTLSEIKKIYKSISEVESVITENENEDMIDIPKLPRGDNHNPYPRMTYAILCELYSKEKYFTISDMCELTGASRNQIKTDILRLEREGYIRDLGSYIGDKSTKFYAYEPTRLVK